MPKLEEWIYSGINYPDWKKDPNVNWNSQEIINMFLIENKASPINNGRIIDSSPKAPAGIKLKVMP